MVVDYGTLFATQPTREKLSEAFDSFEADITYIDNEETVIYFNPFRIFDRPAEILGRNAYECHPSKAKEEMKAMLDQFKAGEIHTRSYESHDRNGRKIRICYHSMRDREGIYLGALEVVTYRED